ncbi:MAG: peptidylprolyl isomerase, partial [Clostridiaceae bacterium]
MENKVLAIVNGNEITEKDLDYTISRVPRERQEMFKTEEGKKELLNQIISFELVYLDAKDKKVDEDAQYLANLETAKKEILTQIAINKILSDVKIEDEEIEKFYNENKDRFKAEATVRAK